MGMIKYDVIGCQCNIEKQKKLLLKLDEAQRKLKTR